MPNTLYQSEALLLVTTPPPIEGRTIDIGTLERQASTFAEMLRSPKVLNAVSLVIQNEDQLQVFNIENTQLIRVTFTNTNPILVQAALNRLCDYFSQYVNDLYYDTSTDQVRALKEQVGNAKQNLEKAQVELLALSNPSTTELEIAQTRVSFLQQGYLDLLARLDAAGQPLVQGQSRVIVYQSANLPIIPFYKPSLYIYVAIAFALSLFLGLGLAFLREFLDDTLKTEEEVLTNTMGLPMLGAIPVMAKGRRLEHEENSANLTSKQKPIQSSSVQVINDPQSFGAEAFRTLRTNIQFLSAEKPLRSLVFTSSSPSEGKTTISANIAASIAQMGQRVVLIDADLRRPYLHKLFELSAFPGLSNYLVGKAELQMILKKTSVPNLQVISSGVLPPMPAELLASGKMQALLQELKTQFEMVILDAPPAIAYTDASLVSKIADGVIVVIACGQTKREQARAAIQTLAKAGITPLGVIMNLVDRRKGYYYYYRSHYNRYEKESEKEEHIF